MKLNIASDVSNNPEAGEFTIVPHWYMYPPKGSYRAGSPNLQVVEGLRSLAGPISLYVHIPFCNMKCTFCSLFASVVNADTSIDDYLSCLQSEIDLLSRYVQAASIRVTQIYFGGGTPSILTEKQVSTVMDLVRRTFRLDADTIMSVEFSPDTVGHQSARVWRDLGASRASLGVQSFDDGILLSMRRKHTGQDARTAVHELLDAGFSDVNVDLIYGHVSQSAAEWMDDVSTALSCGAHSLTIHPLAVRERTGYRAQLRSADLVPPEARLSTLYKAALLKLRMAGWAPTSAVSYSKANRGNPLEEAEADGIPTLGIGAGARTYLPNLHTSSVPYGTPVPVTTVLASYASAIAHGELPIASFVTLNEEERLRRRLLLGLMGRGIDLQLLAHAQRHPMLSGIEGTLAELSHEGLVHVVSGKLVLTDDGLIAAAAVGLRLASREVQRTVAG